jgi:hypothetical protein
MPRLCINCLLAESPCHTHAPRSERRAVAVEPVRKVDSSRALKELCEF